MKTLFILSIVFFYHQSLIGQIFQGEFISDNDAFIITKDTIHFEFETNSAFIIKNRGVGLYEVIDKFLIIRTMNYPGIKSQIIDSTSSSSDAVKIYVKTNDKFLTIIGQNAQGETVESYTLDENKEIRVLKDDMVKSVLFSTFGYDPLTIKLERGLDYDVEIVEGVTIENQNLVFAINYFDQDSINLTLLDIKAENSEIASLKTLNKLKSKKGKLTFWTQTLKKK